ncbi:reverse transcriptase family protein, partial [uncultured Mucilaginibacter sp.]|uniref:reverse transcriptase family protein n=1 Tax=uncultured Mucilaginibacter sp. TaxID=797541 RepID=UPI0025FE8425
MFNLSNPRPYHEPTVNELQHDAGRFKSLRNENDLAALLETGTNNLQLLQVNPEYHVYEIPKKDGSMRLIEDPQDQLKQILHWLNHYLQAIYYFQRPAAVYGFCVSCRDEVDRNVVNNAKSHLGKPFLLVMDLHDFFHTVTIEMVYQTFNSQFPVFESKMIDTLTCISTYKDRLPMGSPASPVISNMAALNMDAELEDFCNAATIKYTRYADDMV